MASSKSPIDWHARPGDPCDVCGADSKGCSRTADALHLCRGAPADPAEWTRTKDTGHAGFVAYRAAADRTNLRGERPTPPARPPIDWPGRAAEYAAKLTPAWRGHGERLLGLPAGALAALPLAGMNGASVGRPYLTLPECDGGGRVVGLVNRLPDPDGGPDLKRSLPGGGRGLTLCEGWRERAGPVLVCEGASDALALAAAGLSAVGRPGDSSGAGFLIRLLKGWPADRGVVILGENDRKPNGDWPGRAGAEAVARAVAAGLGRAVRVAFPPSPAKDVRVWLTAPERGTASWADRGRELLAHVEATAAEVRPGGGASPSPQPSADGPPPPHPDAPLPFSTPTAPAGVRERVDAPHRLARVYLTHHDAGGLPRLWFWRDDWYAWARGYYRPVRDADLLARINLQCQEELERCNRQAVPTDPEKEQPYCLSVNGAAEANIERAMRAVRLVGGESLPPVWLDGRAGPSPAELVAFPNGVLHLPALLAGRADGFTPATPALFTPAVMGFAYDPAPPPPAAWLAFLGQLWSADPASVETLQEWFGYCLTADTSLQKLLLMVGPGRCGKGTILRVLQHMAGTGAAAVSLASLGGEFGLEKLLGKTLAVIADAHVPARGDVAVAVERLKNVVGEDTVTINRKNKPEQDARLGARFALAANTVPELFDPGGAFAMRVLALKLTESFKGKEDTTLEKKLTAELPAIFHWAVAGLVRLRARGRFVQPAGGAELVRLVENLSGKVSNFVRERCVVGSDYRAVKSELYTAFREWCAEGGHGKSLSNAKFGQELLAVVPHLTTGRSARGEGNRAEQYVGIRLRVDTDPEVVGRSADAEVVGWSADTAQTGRNGEPLTASEPGVVGRSADFGHGGGFSEGVASANSPAAAAMQKSADRPTTSGSADPDPQDLAGSADWPAGRPTNTAVKRKLTVVEELGYTLVPTVVSALAPAEVPDEI